MRLSNYRYVWKSIVTEFRDNSDLLWKDNPDNSSFQ